MDRISRQVMYLEMAEVAAKRSTCFRGNVGCVIASNHRVLSIGYNGPPSGDEHCRGNQCQLREDGGCGRSLHAEHNAIRHCERWPIHGADMYCTYSPCAACAEEIIDAKIARFFYRYSYRDPSGLELIKNGGLWVYRVTPSGFIVNQSNQIIDGSQFK